jgi:hypothetical protein
LHIIMLYMFLFYSPCFFAYKASTPGLASIILVSLPARPQPHDLFLLPRASTLWSYCLWIQEHQLSELTVSKNINSLVPGASTHWSYCFWYQEHQLSGLTLVVSARLQPQDLSFSVHILIISMILHYSCFMFMLSHMQLISCLSINIHQNMHHIVLQQYLCVLFMLSHMQVILSHAFYNPSSKHTSHSASTLSVFCVHVIS